MNEQWKEIVEYPGYHASTLGRIKIKTMGTERLLKIGIQKVGYISVRLTNETISKTYGLHRIILQTFNPTDDPTLEVNHKDLNKSNNRLDNLEWVTRKQNMDHAAENGRMDFRYRTGEEHHAYGKEIPEETKLKMSESHNKNNDHPNYKLTDEQVYEIKKKRFEGTDLETLALNYNQTIANISMICSGKRRAKIAPEYTMTGSIRVDKNGVVWNR